MRWKNVQFIVNWNYMIKDCFELHILHTHSRRWHNYAKCSIFKIFCSFLQNPYVLLWSVACILTVGVYFLDHQVSCDLCTAYYCFFNFFFLCKEYLKKYHLFSSYFPFYFHFRICPMNAHNNWKGLEVILIDIKLLCENIKKNSLISYSGLSFFKHIKNKGEKLLSYSRLQVLKCCVYVMGSGQCSTQSCNNELTIDTYCETH